MGWAIALAIIAALCAIVLFTPIRVHITFYKKPEDADVIYFAKIGFWKLRTHSIKTSEKNLLEKLEEFADKLSITELLDDKISAYLKLVVELVKVVAYVLTRALRIEVITLNFHYGTGDAAKTGMLYGVISGIVYGILGAAANFDIVKERNILISPDFENTVFEADGECIVKLRNAYIISAILKLVKSMIDMQDTSE